MNKQIMPKVFLVLLPMMAVVLATTGDSVMIFDAATQTTTYASYFTPVSVGGLTLLPPLAAILTVVTTALAAIYAVATKHWAIRGVIAVSFVAAMSATAPVLMSGETTVVPNALLPILMLITTGLAAWLSKKPAEAVEKHGPRLK